MRRTVLTFALATLVVASPAVPQTAPTPARVVLVQAGQVLERPGRPARGPSTIVVRDGRVVEVRSGLLDASIAEFAGASVIDLRDKYVLPGLVDSHVHLASDTGGVLSQLEEVQLNPAAKAYNALANAHKTLSAGFTTVRNLGDRDGVTLALRDAVRDGQVVGPNIVDAGTAISTTSGHMDPALGFRDDLRGPVRRRGRLPPRGAPAGGARRGRDQDRDHRRREQPHRRGARPADVRRRGTRHRRDRAALRQEGGRARPRTGRREGGARRRRGLDRARHDAR